MESIDVQALSAIVSAAVVLVFAAFTLVTVGGFAAFLAILRANKRALELAYQALPPEAAKVVREIARALKEVADLADDITDGTVTEEESNGAVG